MLIKLGEAIEISRIEDTASCIPTVSPDILENFRKFAVNLKKIAPKAEDFLYFSAVMMHAAEAASLNEDGTPKLTVSGEAVKVGWNKSNDTWRWETNDPNVKPYKNCFVPGTQILMSDGTTKNIEDVESGDMVISHTGKIRKVLRKFITPHNGNVVEIHVRNGRNIVCTDNHSFYKLDVTSLSNKDTPKHLLRNKNSTKEFKFVQAKDLNKNDILTSPILNEKCFSELNYNSARLLGLFAAEGSYAKKYNKYQGVRFSLNVNEKNTLAKLIESLAKEVIPNCSINIHKGSVNAIEVSITGIGVVDFFKYHIGEYSEYKSLSKELLFASKEIKKGFILGWLEGDGTVEKNNGQIIGVTISKNLASQIRHMLNSCGINHSLRHIKSCGTRIINKDYGPTKISDNYRIEICATAGSELIKNSQKLNFTDRGVDKIQNSFYENYALYTISDLIELEYAGNVYNIEVEEDNSYVANDIIVHNCNGDIFPEEELVKAYKKWIGKPLCIDHKSSSVDHVRGFIVDTYYDRNLKRVIALCALDKHNYPDLARKVSTGYSNSVSMGTAVSRAICTEEGCHRVARTEADFCQHMKNKSGYGEINVDLNPIELSIVVNGADPKAHIKHIIAAANTLNTYVENKDRELKKIAEIFTANISMSTGDGEGTHIDLEAQNLEDLKKDIDGAMEQLGRITDSIKNTEENTNDTAFNQSSGTVAMDETVTPNTDFGLATPVRYASTNNVEADLVSELRVVMASMQAKLSQMKTSLDKLANTSTNIQEENMSGTNINKQGYFQGNPADEPTPGQTKYPKDPTNEKLRTDGDKHMDVDNMGAPGQLYPGDLERKKMLARAEAEERAMRRNAIVNMAKQALENKKEAYFQQGDKNPQEPTPGKTKYPADKLNTDLREKSDKHMVGQKPFPGVGAVDGLHPSPNSADTADEGKRKDMMQRASLRARFVKASNNDGSQNLGKSGWEVFLGDKLLLTASVNELSGNRVDLYGNIATKAFGSKLIEKVKVHGAEKVRALVKSAQMPPPPAADAAAAPPPPEAEMPEEGAEDTGKSGDPKETALELAEKARDISSDLLEAVKALTGEQTEMGGEEGAPGAEMAMPPAAPVTASETRALNTLRKELNGALTTAMKESVAELNDHQQELVMIAGMYDKGAVTASNKQFVGSIIEDALTEAKTAVADGFKLMTAFVKYARGTKAIVKRAEIEAELESLAFEGDATMNDEQTADDLSQLISDTDAELNDVGLDLGEEEVDPEMSDLTELFGDEELAGEGEPEFDEELMLEPDSEEQEEEWTEAAADDNDGSPVTLDSDQLKGMLGASFNTVQGRAAMRAKLASDALKTSPHLHEAHPKGSATTQLDVKPSGNLGVVENLEETQKAMLDLANAPPKVRKEAEAIHRLVSEGKLDPADIDSLIAEGLDKDAVSYYKKYWGQVDGGSEFASELVKEHVKAQMEEELGKYRVKLARAYELAYDMVDRGLCHNDRGAVSSQVDEIMKFNDDSFDSLKRVVAKHTPTLRKEAGLIPQVGLIHSGEFAPTSNTEDNLVAQLSAALSKTPKGSF